MNEPKRRGRPPKAALLEPKVEGADVGVTIVDLKPTGPTLSKTVWLNPETHSAQQSAQAYANRVWAKQSPSLSRHERVGRVAAALEAQGLSMEGVVLP